MFGLDPDIGSSALRLWVAAGSAALLVFVCALAFDWTRTRTIVRISVVIVGAVLGGTLAWAFLNAAGARDRNEERRALDGRAAELNVRVLAPGSPLACLDGLSGDSVEAACEKALFASPATVAMAASYVQARLALLADMTAYTHRVGDNIDGALLPLRRGLEADRFGFVAHTLATRDGCTSTNCKSLLLLADSSKVRANLSGETLDRYLDRYVVVWAETPDVPVAQAAPPPAPVAAQTSALAGPPRKSMLNIDFPSSDSIPAVSIMNPEPKGPVTPQTAAAAVAAGQQSSAKVAGPQQMPPMPGTPAAAQKEQKETSAKGKRKQAANPPPAQAGQQAAQQAAPPPGPPVDPVWNPGATLASPGAPQPGATAPAAAASAAPSSAVPLAGMPVQLNPFTSPPQSSGVH
ncbi:MAG TPA: hypothetical protein VHU22_06125 [Xanthobacteraceae bacterium]|jgi:hypothetical protein|nr:hypothetical protein [Xanthobacteraceae bacterium]